MMRIFHNRIFCEVLRTIIKSVKAKSLAVEFHYERVED